MVQLTVVEHSSVPEQDSTVSSSSKREVKSNSGGGAFEGDDDRGSTRSLSTISDVNTEDFKEAIDLLEEKMNGEEESRSESHVEGAPKGQQETNTAHSVEYWTVGPKGKPKTFLKKYSVNRSSRNFRQSGRGRQGQGGNNNTQSMWGNGTSSDSNFSGGNGGLFPPPMISPVFNGNYLPASQIPAVGNSFFHQVPPTVQFCTPSVPAAFPQPIPVPPNIQVFIPPEQAFPAVTPAQFTPVSPITQLSPASLFPLHQQQPYIQYYAPTHGPASYYQGAPLFYQSPSVTIPSVDQFGQPFVNDYMSYPQIGAYGSPFPEGILFSSSVAPAQNYTNNAEEQTGAMEVDSTNMGDLEATSISENSGESQSFITPSVTPTVTPSISETSLSDISHVGMLDEVEMTSATSGYSSSSSSASPLAISKSTLVKDGTCAETLEEIGSENLCASSKNEEASGPLETVPTNGGNPDLERFSLELNDFNNACINAYLQGTNNWAQSLLGVPPHCQQNLMVYPGDSSILIFSLNDGNRSVILYNQQELPYVVNLFDFRVQTSFKQQVGPALNYPYYVPPRTEDDDFFGGQLPIWQVKMVQYFLKYQPNNWKLHGVPEVFNFEFWMGKMMDVVGEFHIVSKLRFCCRTCKIPWTSKKGTIVFKFCYNSTFKQGWILMRIFGQICMRQECYDWTFQNPACYPEEIDRAMKKLSEYIGNQCYGIAVKPNCFDECFKSIRKSGNVGNNNSAKQEREKANISPTPHKKEFCQACMNGVCKNLFAKPFVGVGGQPQLV